MSETAVAAKKKGTLFENLSIAQVVATALAAVTSLLLSSQIGIAGSLLGTAVGSIVATVTAQVYKNIMLASADKIRSNDDDATTTLSPDAMGKGAVARDDGSHEGAASQAALVVGPNATTVLTAVDARDGDAAGRSAGDAAVAGAHARVDAYAPAARGMDVMGGTSQMPVQQAVAGSSTPVASSRREASARNSLIKARSNRARKSQVQRRAIIVSVVAALVAIAITAGLVMLITGGQGWGSTEVLSSSTSTTQAQAATSDTSSSSAESHEAQSKEAASSGSTAKQEDATATDAGNQSAQGDASQGSSDSSSASESNSSSSSSGSASGTTDASSSGSSSGSESNGSSSSSSSNGSSESSSASTGSNSSSSDASSNSSNLSSQSSSTGDSSS